MLILLRTHDHQAATQERPTLRVHFVNDLLHLVHGIIAGGDDHRRRKNPFFKDNPAHRIEPLDLTLDIRRIQVLLVTVPNLLF